MRKRILAMFIDYLIIILICAIPLLIYLSIVVDSSDIRVIDLYTFFGILLVMLKDLIFRNASIGKKIMKIEVRNKDNKVPSIPVIIFRNITIFIWPIECLLILFGKNRIGDWIFNTTVVEK